MLVPLRIDTVALANTPTGCCYRANVCALGQYSLYVEPRAARKALIQEHQQGTLGKGRCRRGRAHQHMQRRPQPQLHYI